jgi:hypothetical protein
MKTTAVIVFGACGLAAASAAWLLWPSNHQRIDLDREIVAPPARAPARRPAPVVRPPGKADVPPDAAPIDAPAAAGTVDADAPAADIDYAAVLPQIIDDPELRAEFEQMLNDPDPEVRQEAEELVRVWLSEEPSDEPL